MNRTADILEQFQNLRYSVEPSSQNIIADVYPDIIHLDARDRIETGMRQLRRDAAAVFHLLPDLVEDVDGWETEQLNFGFRFRRMSRNLDNIRLFAHLYEPTDVVAPAHKHNGRQFISFTSMGHLHQEIGFSETQEVPEILLPVDFKTGSIHEFPFHMWHTLTCPERSVTLVVNEQTPTAAPKQDFPEMSTRDQEFTLGTLGATTPIELVAA